MGSGALLGVRGACAGSREEVGQALPGFLVAARGLRGGPGRGADLERGCTLPEAEGVSFRHPAWQVGEEWPLGCGPHGPRGVQEFSSRVGEYLFF